MKIITLADYKRIKELATSDDFWDKAEAARSELATEETLEILSKDKNWLIREYVIANKNVSKKILEDMLKAETRQSVIREIETRLSYKK